MPLEAAETFLSPRVYVYISGYLLTSIDTIANASLREDTYVS
jgi:hypothetical protein